MGRVCKQRFTRSHIGKQNTQTRSATLDLPRVENHPPAVGIPIFHDHIASVDRVQLADVHPERNS
eukprot:2153369-Rhodomonas_salina.3